MSSPPLLCQPTTVSPVLLSHGGGSSEVGEEFVTEAHHEIPDVSGHLGPGNEDSPDENNQDGVEGVADIPQSGKQNWDKLGSWKKI